MNNYLCKKCTTLLQAISTPKNATCAKGGIHTWTNLGLSGTDAYQCGKCHVAVCSKELPKNVNCPTGGMHQWGKR